MPFFGVIKQEDFHPQNMKGMKKVKEGVWDMILTEGVRSLNYRVGELHMKPFICSHL